MSKKVLLSIFSFFLIVVVAAQTTDSSVFTSELMEKMGKEGVYVHYNSNILFSGEYLNFKLYALGENAQASPVLSKIAYVELIDINGERLMIEKIRMDNGQGQGDFFIPTSLKSGYYTLVAYTNYMRNWDSDILYKDQLLVINPYTSDQQPFWESDRVEMESVNETFNTPNEAGYSDVKNQNPGLNLCTDKPEYGTRERVELTINSKLDSWGTYSVSIKQASDILRYKPRLSPAEYLEQYRSMKVDNHTSTMFLPELRGEIFTGKLTDEDGQGVSNQKVIFSLPGNPYELKIIPTDASGNFMFTLNSGNLEPRAVFQVLSDNQSDYDIDIFDRPELAIGNLPHTRFYLNKEMERAIADRSIYNQIENAYFNVKPDTVQLDIGRAPSFIYDIYEYNLDDYTRFPTFQETLVEIVNHAWITSGNQGKRRLFVRDYEGSPSNTGYNPLVIIDGIVIQDHEDLIGFDVNKIKSIGLGRSHYAVSGQVFQGIIDVESFDDYFLENYSNPNMKVLLRPQPIKKYFKQAYGTEETFKSIPDFRQQLLWEPNLVLDKPITQLVFQTSDVKGDFEIVIEGFTNQKQPVRVVAHFTTK